MLRKKYAKDAKRLNKKSLPKVGVLNPSQKKQTENLHRESPLSSKERGRGELEDLKITGD